MGIVAPEMVFITTVYPVDMGLEEGVHPLSGRLCDAILAATKLMGQFSDPHPAPKRNNSATSGLVWEFQQGNKPFRKQSGKEETWLQTDTDL